MLVAASVLVLVGAGGVLATATGGAERTSEASSTHPARQDVRLTVPSGYLRLRTGDVERVEVERIERWTLGAAQPRMDVKDDGEELRIDAGCQVIAISVGADCRIELDVVVPVGTRVTAEVGTGDVDVAGTYDGLVVRVAVGDVRVERACAEVVEVQVVVGAALGGLGCAPSRGVVEVLGGGLRFGIPAGDYRLSAESALGDVSLWPGVVVDDAAPRQLELYAGSGDVEAVP